MALGTGVSSCLPAFGFVGYSYVACPACGCYTASSSRDSFTMGYTDPPPGAISKEKGDEIVRLIETCPAHQEFRGGY